MKIARYKKVQRYLSFYCNNFGFRAPYQLLIDGTFCFSARKEQINIKEQIPKYLVAEVKLLTTKCVLIEAEKIAKKVTGALTILKQFAIHECNHKEPISGADCILSMVGKANSSHYIIATQDRALQNTLRSKIGIPLLYLHLKAPTLEKPTQKSYDLAQKKQEKLLGKINNVQEEILTDLKKKVGIAEEEAVIKRKKKRKGGPNPLSCLKKKKKQQNSQAVQGTSGKVNKRKRIKLPAHVKEVLKAK